MLRRYPRQIQGRVTGIHIESFFQDLVNPRQSRENRLIGARIEIKRVSPRELRHASYDLSSGSPHLGGRLPIAAVRF